MIQKKLDKGKKNYLWKMKFKFLKKKLQQLNEGNEITFNDEKENKFLSNLGFIKY